MARGRPTTHEADSDGGSSTGDVSCPICHISENDASGLWIECDSCKGWFHQNCVNVNHPAGTVVIWTCTGCQEEEPIQESLNITEAANPTAGSETPNVSDILETPDVPAALNPHQEPAIPNPGTSNEIINNNNRSNTRAVNQQEALDASTRSPTQLSSSLREASSILETALGNVAASKSLQEEMLEMVRSTRRLGDSREPASVRLNQSSYSWPTNRNQGAIPKRSASQTATTTTSRMTTCSHLTNGRQPTPTENSSNNAIDEEIKLLQEVMEMKMRLLQLVQEKNGSNQSTQNNRAPAATPAVDIQPSNHSQARDSPNLGPSRSTNRQQGPTDTRSTGTRDQLDEAAVHRSDNNLDTEQSPEDIRAERFMKIMSRPHLPTLPIFDGSAPELFPIWLGIYENTTRDGAYENSDNLPRIDTSIQGRAKKLIQANLFSPDGVPEAIKDLKKEYGNPRVIIGRVRQNLTRAANVNENNPAEMKELYLLVKNAVKTLEQIGAANYLDSPAVVDDLEQKFPDNLKRQFRTFVQRNLKKDLNQYCLRDLEKWLEYQTEWITMEELQGNRSRINRNQRVHHHRTPLNRDHSSASSASNDSSQENKKFCLFCKRQNHELNDCRIFARKDADKRRRFARQRKICFACLREGHSRSGCVQEPKKCNTNGCQSTHHQLLHANINEKDSKQGPMNNNEGHVSVHTKSPQIGVVYRILPVKLYWRGQSLTTNAFLDEGSSVTLLKTELARKLNASGTKEPLCMAWTEDTVRNERDSERLTIEISGATNQAKRFKIRDVRTVSKLCLPIPNTNPHQVQQGFKHLLNVNFPPFLPEAPGILIGLNHAKLSVPKEVREGNTDQPIATRTRLGWVLHGRITKPDNNVEQCCTVCECNDQPGLSQLVERFFSMEACESPINSKWLESKEIQRARQVLEHTTKQVGLRYQTGLLWKTDTIHLPDNYGTAYKRLLCLERQMEKSPDLKKAVLERVQENIEKGYARKLTWSEAQERSSKTWYLPVFAVTNPHKPDKIRLVYDAAAKTNNVCLNDFLLTGPDLLKSLTSVLSKHREFKVAISGDVKEMFHRVLIQKEDQDSQRFLMRDNPMRPPDTYVMVAMTFGAKCSPCSAQYVKNEHAKKYVEQFPRAVLSILDRHYMDDLLDSFVTPEEALRTAKDVTYIYQQAGMEIRGWKSNADFIARELNGEKENESLLNLDIAGQQSIDKILGMFWNTRRDNYTFRLNFVRVKKDLIALERIPTKREFLKILMSIYDPLGLVANVVIYGKMLLSEIWDRSIDWDEKLPNDLNAKWQKWLAELKSLEKVEIPRCYSPLIPNADDLSLQIFVDASKDAYAAVAYLLVEQEGVKNIALIRSKTRVAPRRQQTIPRLELQAAVLGIRLAKLIQHEHSLLFNYVQYWSDSQTVLQWIRSENKKFTVFVAHRIAEILENSQAEQWKWVPGKLNPADEGTKWNGKPNLSPDSKWLNGPNFLTRPKEEWPQETNELPIQPLEEEIVRVQVHQEIPEAFSVIDARRFSSWEKTVRTVGWIIKFATSCKSENKVDKSKRGQILQGVNKGKVSSTLELNAEEIKKAENILIKKIQWEAFKDDIEELTANRVVKSTSKILKLSPALDEAGIMRLKGRIDSAPIVLNQAKRPIILSRHHPLTELIVDAYHRKFKHQGAETVVSAVRQQFWIPDIRVAVRHARSNCQFCKNQSAQPKVPEMAPLPFDRLAAYERPFSYIGMDFFGPIEIVVGRSRQKRWGVIFTCLVIRAVHVDIVPSMDADSCIIVIRNFVARFGQPKVIRCDRGTNLVGAERELKEALEQVDLQKVEKESQDFIPGVPRTIWKFNPGKAAHMGGSWERLIRSLKTVLYTMFQAKVLREHTLRNFLLEAADIINSRPLSYQIMDPDEEILTPNHFLRLSGTVNLAPGLFEKEDCQRKQWRIAQDLTNQFWKKWIDNYLPELTRRTKWFTNVKELEVGDIVLIVESSTPRNTWRKGKILDVIPGRDGHIRSAVVQVNTGTLSRPASKLAVLDVNKRPTE